MMTLEEQFEAIDESTIDGYIANKEPERLQLEFKCVNDSSFESRDDRKNLAKALSGFANSSGGIVVWGVDCRRNQDGVDYATARHEIQNARLFESRLNELTGEAVHPRVEGIRHKAILTNGDSGFAATLVPESDSGPHMAKLGEDRYYKRSGDSFYKMEHFDVADMFGKRRRPKLIVRVPSLVAYNDPVPHYQPPTQIHVRILLSIYNEGRGSARAPYLALYRNGDYKLESHSGRGLGLSRFNRHSQGPKYLFHSMDHTVIHPEMHLDAVWIKTTYELENLSVNDMSIEYDITSLDMSLKNNIVEIPGKIIRKEVDKRLDQIRK